MAYTHVLIVFDDDLTQTHFLRVAHEEMQRIRVRVPLLVSYRAVLEETGPPGTGWSAVDKSSRPAPSAQL